MADSGDKARLFDAQYAAFGGDEANALDYPLYRYLLPYATSRVEVACRMLGDERFDSVVELGVGKGEIALRKLAQFDRYLGLDISPYQLSLVPEAVRSASNVCLQQADLEATLAIADASMDLAISLSTIEYLRDPEHFVREVHRVLRPGGVFLLHTMNLAFLPRRIQLAFGKLPTFNSAPGWQGGVLHEFTYPTLKALLVAMGFAIEDVRCSGLFPQLRAPWREGLASDMLFRCRKR